MGKVNKTSSVSEQVSIITRTSGKKKKQSKMRDNIQGDEKSIKKKERR